MEILREIVKLAVESKDCRPNYHRPGAEEVAVRWRGAELFLVWDRGSRFIYTFLPPRIPRPPKRGRRRWNKR